jgi:hypothetical protein
LKLFQPIASDLTSESWYLNARTTSVPSTSSSACGGATLAFQSTRSVGGVRSGRLFDKTNYAFAHYSLSHAAISKVNFRCNCLSKCSSTANCSYATIVDKVGKYFCYGLLHVGVSKATSIVSGNLSIRYSLRSKGITLYVFHPLQ